MEQVYAQKKCEKPKRDSLVSNPPNQPTTDSRNLALDEPARDLTGRSTADPRVISEAPALNTADIPPAAGAALGAAVSASQASMGTAGQLVS